MEVTAERDNATAQLQEANQQLRAMRNVTAERDVAIAQLHEARQELQTLRGIIAERDAAIAQLDEARQQLQGFMAAMICPFERYRPHLIVPGVIPPQRGFGVVDVEESSPLFRFCRGLCSTSGSWSTGKQRPVAGYRLVCVQAVVHESNTYVAYTSSQDRM